MIICAVRYLALNCACTAACNSHCLYWSTKEAKTASISKTRGNILFILFSRQYSTCFTEELLQTFHQSFRCHNCFLRTVDHLTVFLCVFWETMKRKHHLSTSAKHTACQDRAGCTYMGEIQQRPDSISLIPFPMTFHCRPAQKNMCSSGLCKKELRKKGP